MFCNKLKYNIILIAVFLFFLNVDAKKIVITAPIAEKEYVDCKDIEEVIIENDCGIYEIPDYAFLGCENLKSVKLPEGLKKIGFQAFSECSGLETINFPSSIEDIGSNSFTYCTMLNNLVFPDGLKHIGHNAFSFCTSLERVKLPSSIEELESYAFSDCDSLREASLPANGNLLGELIFNCCQSLEKIEEVSPEVPKFDCESFIFDPADKTAYKRCTLAVLPSMGEKYKKAPGWSLFENFVFSIGK